MSTPHTEPAGNDLNDIPALGLTALPGQKTPSWLRDSAVASLRLLEGLAFPPEEYHQRWHGVRDVLQRRQLAAVIAFRPSTVDYLCGYRTSAVTETPVLMSGDHTVLVLPTAEVGRAIVGACPGEAWFADPHLDPVALGIKEFCRRLPRGALVGIEYNDAYTPVRAVDLVRRAGCTPVNADFLVERIRLTLSPAEIDCMRLAADITAAGVSAAVSAAAEQAATDSGIAAAVLRAITTGADCLVKPEVVVSTGWRGGITHSSWAGQRLVANSTTFLEFTGARHHYVAPVMRTLLHGDPTPEIRYLDDRARRTLDATIAALQPGVRAKDIARTVTGQLGELDPNVVWHYTYGYPVGIAHGKSWVDTVPFDVLSLRADCDAQIQPGMAFHLPASFRWFGHAAVGYSETVVVTETGTEVLTAAAGIPSLIKVA